MLGNHYIESRLQVKYYPKNDPPKPTSVQDTKNSVEVPSNSKAASSITPKHEKMLAKKKGKNRSKVPPMPTPSQDTKNATEAVSSSKAASSITPKHEKTSAKENGKNSNKDPPKPTSSQDTKNATEAVSSSKAARSSIPEHEQTLAEMEQYLDDDNSIFYNAMVIMNGTIKAQQKKLEEQEQALENLRTQMNCGGLKMLKGLIDRDATESKSTFCWKLRVFTNNIVSESSNTFSLDGGNYLVEWAIANNKTIRGHTLCWHSQLPGWVSSLSSSAIEAALKNHIITLMTKWKGKIMHWDVVNEVLNEQGQLDTSKPFMSKMGEKFIKVAFETARATDPDAKFYAKTTGMANLVKKWLGQGIPIDGIGSQAHLQSGQGAGFAAALTTLANSGVSEVAVTELDIVGASSTDYVNVAKACVQQKKCVGITSWGVRDPDSWRASNNPLMFDAQYKPKAAYDAVYNVVVPGLMSNIELFIMGQSIPFDRFG
ncbi:putative endo-1,4-beta-xylanase F3 [Glarea lozoyensis 74030]|uniref:Beta-xylanase n=1 Tax=Glarea lozoyensis (strain ATCC 74030 / MF5533) TaxID=1104152 RepID=H0EHV0_GLAL7|nr:putative endo-1,4-beta-xylanase F3 [Glarea lozoyensis 74030]